MGSAATSQARSARAKWVRIVALGAALVSVPLLLPASAPAAGRPNLVISKLSASPATLAPGAMLTVADALENRGKLTAMRSTTGYYLSRDRVRSRGDVALGKRAVEKLKPRKRSRGRIQLIAPAGTAPGTYSLLACADAKGRIAETNEKDNCRASAPIELAAASPPAPQGSPPAPQPPPEYLTGHFPRPANPLAVSPTLEQERSATGMVYTFGGTVTATASNGTVFSLTLPANALLSATEITLTPVGSVGGLPFSDGLIGAVQIEPEGLELQKPATLTIEPPSTGPIPEQTGFVFHEGGGDFHLYPLDMGATLKMELMHFSTPGVGLATPTDRETVIEHMPQRTRAQYEQLVSELVRTERAAQLLGQPGNPEFGEELANLVIRYYDDVVRSQLIAAETDDSLARQAIAEALTWARQGALLGLEEDPSYVARSSEMMERIQRILTNATNQAYTRCVQGHELDEIISLVALERTSQLLGFDLGNPFEKMEKCARFEVGFDSQITQQQSWSAEDGRSYSLNAQFHVRSQEVIISWLGTGEGSLVWTSFSYEALNTYPCTSEGTLYSHSSGKGTTPGKMQAALRLDLNPRETPPGQSAPPPPESMLDLYTGSPTHPTETYGNWDEGCTSEVFPDDTASMWYDGFRDFHEYSGHLRIPIPIGSQVGDLILTKAYTQNVGAGDMTGAKVTELTTVELWHRPQS